MVVPPPGLLSITIAWPSLPCRCCASSRAITSLGEPGVYGTMMRTGLPGKPCGSAADGLAASASAAMAATHANPPAADRPMPCAPSRILARRADGAISALTPIDAKENARPCWAGPAAIPSTSTLTPCALGASGHDARFPRAAAASKELLVEVDHNAHAARCRRAAFLFCTLGIWALIHAVLFHSAPFC